MIGFTRQNKRISIDLGDCVFCENYVKINSLLIKHNKKLYDITDNLTIANHIFNSKNYSVCYACATLLDSKSINYNNRFLIVRNNELLKKSFWSNLNINSLKQIINKFMIDDTQLKKKRYNLYRVFNKSLICYLPEDMIRTIFFHTTTHYIFQCYEKIMVNETK